MAITSDVLRTNLSKDGDLHLLLSWSSGESDIPENYTPIYWELKLVSTKYASVSTSRAKNYSVTVDDQTWSGTNNITLSQGQTKVLASGSKNVYHDTNGYKWLTISFYQEINITYSTSNGSYKIESGSGSNGWELPTIPRYTTVYNSLRSRTINTISVNWSTTDARDWTQYSLNDGGWQDAYDTVASDNKSGYYVLGGLQPNTTYRIKTRCRRTDSGLWSEAGQITITTYDIAKMTDAPNFTDESNPTIYYNNPFGNNVGSLQACISFNGSKDDIPYRAISKTDNYYTFYLTDAERRTLRTKATSNNLSVTFYLRTDYNGGSYYSTITRTMSMVNADPIFSNFTYEDVNPTTINLTGNNQIIVKGFSNVIGTIPVANKATAIKEASMKEYRLTIGDKTATAPYSSSAAVRVPSSSSLLSVTSASIEMYAIDSRNNSTKRQVALSSTYFKNYNPIFIAYLEAVRQGGVGSETTLNFSVKYWNGNFGSVDNDITSCRYRYKKTYEGDSSFQEGTTTLTYSKSNGTLTGSVVIQGDKGAEGFDVSNSYHIQLIIADKLSATTSIFTMGSGTPAVAVYKDNIAIGQKYDISRGGKLQVNGNRMSLSSTGEAGDAVYYEFYKNGRRAAWIGFGNNNDTLFYINNEQNERIRILNELEWESVSSPGIDCNNIVMSGIRYITENSNNIPSPFCRLLTMGASYSGDTSQLATYVSSGATFVRGRSNGTWHPWLHLLGARTIFYNESGTSGTITLVESSEYFSYIDIIYGKGTDTLQSVRVYNPHGKGATLITGYVESNAFGQIQLSRVLINGTSITKNSPGLLNFGTDEVKIWTSDEVKIYQVIGYK